ncbi:MAG: hypothetical protein QG608_1370 [Actinomycetota bacterium]|nr:hypothetical protein [Actinomycetota bacterium]
MSAKDAIFDVDLTERFLDAKATPEEQERLGRAFAEYYPAENSLPQEIDDRVRYIADQLDPPAIRMWFRHYPGLPRFITSLYELIDLIEMFEEDDWTVDNIRTIDVPEQLQYEWNKNTELAGLAMMKSSLDGALNHRRFPYAGWLADEVLQLLLRACDGPRGSKRRRNGFRKDLTVTLTALRENATLAGISFSAELPEDW